ncbi:MAG: class I SAM-dependent methyltransferase [Acidobacteria bacterium]|nr:class I SAM-dependent methyltransferase [Acidobacteriota bacterium]MCW5968935.1 class I SAM-dependent methyltransferase [Blastocatellales bacterium]
MSDKAHWEHIYETKDARHVSWYQDHAVLSLQLIKSTGIGSAAPIIDVGGGASTLVDDLLSAGYGNITVLDISGTALQRSQDRLGQLAKTVTWVEADITLADLPENYYDVWHDRAVFHFLTEEADRIAYVRAVNRSVKMGGHVIVASFGLEGPEKCSGLNVVRYSPKSMHDTFGEEFRLIDSATEMHHTPFGTDQEFVYCYCRKV